MVPPASRTLVPSLAPSKTGVRMTTERLGGAPLPYAQEVGRFHGVSRLEQTTPLVAETGSGRRDEEVPMTRHPHASMHPSALLGAVEGSATPPAHAPFAGLPNQLTSRRVQEHQRGGTPLRGALREGLWRFSIRNQVKPPPDPLGVGRVGSGGSGRGLAGWRRAGYGALSHRPRPFPTTVVGPQDPGCQPGVSHFRQHGTPNTCAGKR